MDRIIRDLYCGRYEIFEREYHARPEYAKALDEILRIGQEIEGVAPEELKPLFLQYSDACSILSNIAGEEEYLRGYRLGAQMMLAAFSKESPQASDHIPE